MPKHTKWHPDDPELQAALEDAIRRINAAFPPGSFSRPGRPLESPTPREKSTISIRVTPALKRRLAAAATANDRSLSQETEIRIEQSFLAADHLETAMQMAHGARFAGILELLGQVMRRAGEAASYVSKSGQAQGDDWLDNGFAYHEAMHAAFWVLEYLQPDASERPKSTRIGINYARGVMATLARRSESRLSAADWVTRMREKLGSLVDRIKPNSRFAPDEPQEETQDKRRA